MKIRYDISYEIVFATSYTELHFLISPLLVVQMTSNFIVFPSTQVFLGSTIKFEVDWWYYCITNFIQTFLFPADLGGNWKVWIKFVKLIWH